MTFRLRIRPAADHDVDELAAYIARQSLEQALRFYDAVADTYKLILQAPSRWPIYEFSNPRLGGIRKRAVRGFRNHLVFYRIDSNKVEIIRVLHGARDIPAILEESPGEP
ncbi:MAG TPA: type II toxin-antitoxin system RelE/ParE family toxin [Tepidisphaeraceae bacterium]|jgi:toxin ParE1/3/4|nr:type II toxin-antitoxin system RelE/ParE family toxin [Tepidisphaeraceae bacterium]